MKRLLLVLSLFILGGPLLAQNSCVHKEQREKMKKEHPELIQEQETRNQFLENFTQNFSNSTSVRSSENLLIPVVFHVVHNNGIENISDAQINESIVSSL